MNSQPTEIRNNVVTLEAKREPLTTSALLRMVKQCNAIDRLPCNPPPHPPLPRGGRGSGMEVMDGGDLNSYLSGERLLSS